MDRQEIDDSIMIVAGIIMLILIVLASQTK